MSEKISVIFVDDEPNILSGLKRLMRTMRDEWDMDFCSGAVEALELMKSKPVDVVISDMRMPGIDGAQLLEQVRALYPGAIRVILSGYADSESVLRTVGPAHVYLAKPCDPHALQEAILRPLRLRKRLNCPEMQKLLAGLSSLPSLPDVFLRLNAELQSPNSSAASVADIISTDLAMTAEILRLTNSAYFSTAVKVSTPLHAVKTLGLEIIQSLVLRNGIFRQFSGSSRVAALLKDINDYSMAISTHAEQIAKAESMDSFVIAMSRCAGMLSPIGILVLLDDQGEDYRKLMASASSHRQLCLLEFERYGVDHHLINAYLLGLWGFNDWVVEAVALASEPSSSAGAENQVLTTVHAALALAPRLPGLGIVPDGDPHEDIDLDYIRFVGREAQIGAWRAITSSTKLKD